jgi:hypothetical protein
MVTQHSQYIVLDIHHKLATRICINFDSELMVSQMWTGGHCSTGAAVDFHDHLGVETICAGRGNCLLLGFFIMTYSIFYTPIKIVDFTTRSSDIGITTQTSPDTDVQSIILRAKSALFSMIRSFTLFYCPKIDHVCVFSKYATRHSTIRISIPSFKG